MVVGDRRRFAVEFELDPSKLANPELKEWLFGRVCFWCCGERVGRHDEEATIRDVAIEAERFLRHEGTRGAGDLLAAPREAVLATLINALYEDSGQSDARVQADWERLGRLVVCPAVDVFDDWRILLVEGEGIGRLIWSRKGEAGARECALRQGEFDEVLREFLSVLRRTGGGK